MSADLEALARDALANGEEEAAESELAAALANYPRDVRLLHWHGLLLRALDRRDEALAALEAARSLAPGDGGIAHGLAQIALEAGKPAAALFEAAVRLAPSRPDIRLGLASARYAEGTGEQALAELDAMLAGNAGWYEGHRQYAHLASMLGHGDQALATIERALGTHGRAAPLHLLAIELLFDAERHAEAGAAVERAIAVFGEAPQLLLHRAAVLDETGRSADAALIFARLGTPSEQGHAIRLLRHLLRLGRPEDADAVLASWLAKEGVEQVWPYAALIWRQTGDPRADWLEPEQGLHTAIDIPPDEIALPELTETLRSLHAQAGRFLNQSVRHGTQTDGPLLARTDPPIRRIRERLRQEIAHYVKRLPPADATHPTLSQRRDRRVRFAGSWSARLTDRGFHESHFHPQGWLSAVFYVTTPRDFGAGEGQLVLGEMPAGLGKSLGPRAIFEPVPGRLVIFPSTMFHATTPFSAGERMTIAFDIARP